MRALKSRKTSFALCEKAPPVSPNEFSAGIQSALAWDHFARWGGKESVLLGLALRGLAALGLAPAPAASKLHGRSGK